jgi:pimeloyl-ACP methyl ester carboxylesterase
MLILRLFECPFSNAILSTQPTKEAAASVSIPFLSLKFTAVRPLHPIFGFFIVAVSLTQFEVQYAAASERVFQVQLGPAFRGEPKEGRLIVFLIAEGSQVPKGTEPVDGPFWDDPQPVLAMDAMLRADNTATLDDKSDWFPVPPSKLAPGKYRAQARLDLVRNNSNWRREAGNLWSEVVTFEVKDSNLKQEVRLTLTKAIELPALKQTDGVEWFEVRSSLLSKFRGRDVFLRAGVVMPRSFDAARKYPAIYEVPGFGGDHSEAAGNRRTPGESNDATSLAKSAFRIVLDPEGPNGHTLFADSENNGPCGQALTQELVPALEAKYPLIAVSSARLLRGHSSGGWTTLWLAIRYPEVFGATWSSAPDPVDFRRFQKVDIYGQPNFYVDAKGADLPSLRKGDVVEMTIRQEARGEDMLGPDNTSAQQWDSWFAAFGPKNSNGNPAALFDPVTGQIHTNIAEHYQKFDIGLLLRKNPSGLVPLFRNNVRLVVGTEDSFYLNEAVALLDAELTQLGRAPTDRGYVKMIPGDHGSIFSSEAVRSFPKEMLEHLRKAEHIQ